MPVYIRYCPSCDHEEEYISSVEDRVVEAVKPCPYCFDTDMKKKGAAIFSFVVHGLCAENGYSENFVDAETARVKEKCRKERRDPTAEEVDRTLGGVLGKPTKNEKKLNQMVHDHILEHGE